MSADALAIVRRFSHALHERDLAGAGGLLHHACMVNAAGGLPFSGCYRGPQGFFDLFAAMNEVLDLTPGPMRQQSIDDRTVLSRFRLRFEGRASRRCVEMDLVEIYTVSDGQIVELDVYYKDPSAVAGLLR